MKQVDIEPLLPLVDKPARYIDHEINAVRKDYAAFPVRFAFAFPDVYELGISHLGLKILYSIVNRLDYAMADRAYLPWLDLGDLMRKQGLPLFGWESRMPLRAFDVLGITLQSELTYTNVLELLDLAQVPLRSDARASHHPIVMTGGPCASNPLPLSPFIDVFYMGEAEEGIVQIADILRTYPGREDRLRHLATLESCYVPALQGDTKHITCRKFSNFSTGEDQHQPQLLSWQLATHNRYVAEIMRGCSRGCRFCHAGYFYRPVRERSPEVILKNLLSEVRQSGWDEAGLISLSSSDYSCIQELLLSLLQQLDTEKTHVSLPSLRVDSLGDDLVTAMRELGREGLTIAPEAGSERLRLVINKNLTEADILKGVETAIKLGWQRIKLYFMLGLPTETDEDIEAITLLIKKINALGRNRLQIGVTLSPFVPKPFTPFQWAAMLDSRTLLSRAMLVKNAFARSRNIRIKYHTIESSVLEGIISRGDAALALALETAWKKGARFDGWNECFDFQRWEAAFTESGIDYHNYLQERAIDQPLPWDFVDTGVCREFLLSEWAKATQAVGTEDCREICSLCGICDDCVHHDLASSTPKDSSVPSTLPPMVEKPEINPAQKLQLQFRYRVYYQKLGLLKYISHLDWMRMLFRRIAVLELQTVFTQGFSPHPKVSLSPPLPVGVEGLREFFDISFLQPYRPEQVVAALNLTRLPDFVILDCETIGSKGPLPLAEEISIRLPEHLQNEAELARQRFYQQSELPFTKTTETRSKTYDLRKIILGMELCEGILLLRKELESPSLYDLLSALLGWDKTVLYTLPIARTGFIF